LKLVQDFIASIGKADPAPCILICPHKPPRATNQSFEPFLAERAVNALIAEYTDPATKDFAFNVFYGDEAEAGEIVSVAQTYPFLASRRVVIVHNADELQTGTDAEILTAYVNSPSESTVLVLVAPTIDRRLKLFKAFEKAGEIVESPELKGAELQAWVKKEAATLKKKISPEAIHQLLERAGTSLSDVNNALTVVANFTGDRADIAEQDVLTACADVAEEQIWALTDAIAASDSKKAMHVLRQMFELGKNEFEILGTVNWLIKSTWNLANASPGDPITKLFQSKKFMPLVEKFGKERLRRAFGLIVEADLMMRSTGVDRNLVLELLVVRLAGSTPKKRPARSA
jgi:DNA polymerase-3 subunit delta